MSYRRVCFTAWTKPKISEENFYYVGWAEEICPLTGKHHWQGVAHSRKTMRPNQWREQLGVTDIKLNSQRGSNQEAIGYFKDPSNHNKTPYLELYEFGSPSSQGMRGTNGTTKVSEIRMTLQTKTIAEAIETAETLHEIQTIEKVASYQKPPDIKREVHWIWGEPGTGKTEMARQIAGEGHYLTDGEYGIALFNGYMEERSVVMDDLKPKNCNIAQLLRITDKYPARVNVKYGYRRWLAEKVVITSVYSPQRFWSLSECRHEDDWQLLRRITSVIETHRDVSRLV